MPDPAPSPDTTGPAPVSGVVAAPAAAPSPSTRPAAPVPAVVQAIDHLGELAAIVCLTVLAARGKLSGELALTGILMTLGVQTGLRTVARRGVGAVGIAVLALGPALLRTLGVAAIVLVVAGLGLTAF